MRILLISQYFSPELEAGAYRIQDLARLFFREGHQVLVSTGMPNFPTGVKPAAYRWRLFKREQVEGVHVLRTYVYACPNRGFVQRVVNYMSFVVSCTFVHLFTGPYDVVVATSPPLSVGLAGLWISWWKRGPFIFEVRDIWPASAVALGALRNKHVVWCLERLELLFYRKAAKIVVVTEGSKRILTQRGIPAEKVAVIRNGVDVELFRPQAKANWVRQRYDLEGKFIVMYLGTHGLSQGLSTIMECANLLRSQTDIAFMFVGEGAEKPRLMQRKDALNLRNVLFVEGQPKAWVPDFLAAADVCVVPLINTRLFLDVVPSKLYECMAAARPVVLAVDGEARRILEAASGGIFVKPEDPHDMASAILKLYQDESLQEALGANGRRYALTYCGRELLNVKYSSLLQEVLARSTAGA